jgi:hypothetical protein
MLRAAQRGYSNSTILPASVGKAKLWTGVTLQSSLPLYDPPACLLYNRYTVPAARVRQSCTFDSDNSNTQSLFPESFVPSEFCRTV